MQLDLVFFGVKMYWHEKHTLCITHRFLAQVEKMTSSQCFGLVVSSLGNSCRCVLPVDCAQPSSVALIVVVNE